MSDTAKPAPDFGSGLSRAMRWAMTERVWALFVVGIVTALVLVFALIPVVYDTMHLADTLFLASVGWRIFQGAEPVLDFGHFYGGVAGQYVAWAFALFGPTIKALDYAVLLQLATVLVVALAGSWRRTSRFGFWVLVLLVSTCLLARAPLEIGTAVVRITSAHSFSYNRLGLVLALIVTVIALVPARGRGAEAAGGVLAGVALYAVALTKPTFAAFVPAVLLALVAQQRWSCLFACLLGCLVGMMLMDPGAQKLVGAFDYAMAGGAGRAVTPVDLVRKSLQILLAQPVALAAVAAALGLVLAWTSDSWRFVFSVAFVGGGGLSMMATMGGEGAVAQQALPFLAVLALAFLERIRRLTAPPTASVAITLVLVSGFALPHAANTLAAGAEALDRRGQILLQEGPLAGYLSVDDAFPLPPTKPVDAAARYLDVGQPIDNGVQYVLLVDGVAALRQFKDVSRYGIVSDNGLNFDFALGAPSVLEYPVWMQGDSPEFAGMRVMPAAVDLVLVRRRGQDEFSGQLRDRLEGDFTLCRQTLLWDIFARRARDIAACTA